MKSRAALLCAALLFALGARLCRGAYVFDESGRPVPVDKKEEKKPEKPKPKPKKKPAAVKKKLSKKPGKRRPWAKKELLSKPAVDSEKIEEEQPAPGQ